MPQTWICHHTTCPSGRKPKGTLSPVLQQQPAELLETTATKILQESTGWMAAEETLLHGKQILHLSTSLLLRFS